MAKGSKPRGVEVENIKVTIQEIRDVSVIGKKRSKDSPIGASTLDGAPKKKKNEAEEGITNGTIESKGKKKRIKIWR